MTFRRQFPLNCVRRSAECGHGRGFEYVQIYVCGHYLYFMKTGFERSVILKGKKVQQRNDFFIDLMPKFWHRKYCIKINISLLDVLYVRGLMIESFPAFCAQSGNIGSK